MAFQDRLTVVIDFVTGPAQSGLKKLRTDVAQAEGAMGKAKVAAVGLGGALQQYAGQAALAAGAALVTFGVKSVKAFQDTALAAGKFADAAGISVEAASRLMEVSSDLGIESGAVQGAIQKMNLAIANGKPGLDEFADSIVRAKDGSVDSAATFQNLVTKIGAIKDSTERARVAQQVFGKSYGEIALLMELSAGDLAKRLEEVSDAQVIDPDERKKAEEFRDALDDLSDKVDQLMMATGEGLVPALTDAAEAMSNLVDAGRALDNGFKKVFGSTLVDAINPLDNLASGVNRVFGDGVSVVDRFKGGVELVAGAFPGVGEAVSNVIGPLEEATEAVEGFVAAGTDEAAAMAAMYAERIPQAVEQSKVAVFKFRDATADAKAKADDLEAQWATLFGTLDDQEALLNLQNQFDELYAAGVDAYAAGVEGSEDAAEAQKRHQQAIIDTKREVGTYAKEVLGLPVERVTKILADIDAGKLDQVEQQLAILSRNRTVSVSIVAKGGAGYEIPIDGKRARGGPVQAGRAYVVGEEGEELFVPGQSGTVIPNGGTRAIASGATAAAPMVVNITTGADPEDVVRAIERYRKRNGSLPFI
jgi:hypothetical protein